MFHGPVDYTELLFKALIVTEEATSQYLHYQLSHAYMRH